MGMDFGTAMNMPSTFSKDALATGAGMYDTGKGGFFSSLMDALAGKGDVLSIAADQVGQKMNPTGSNVFGGLGTSLAKSKIAGEKQAQDKSETEDMISKIIKDLNSSSDMNKVGIMKNPDGTIKIDQQTNVPKHIDSTLPTKEKSVSANKTEGQESIGSMQDMMEMYK